jgi:tetratricopeptide (TPR) repeat protein
MRTLTALALYVSLAQAGDWDVNTKEGVAEARERLESSWRTSKDPSTAARLTAVYRLNGDYAQAERVSRDALHASPADPEVKATLLNALADMLREQARDAESRRHFEEAAHVVGAPWQCRIESLAGLANLDRDTGKWQSAIQLARDHHDRFLESVTLRGMAETWIALKNSARAEPLLRQALVFFETGPDDNGFQTAATLSVLAQVYIDDDKAAMAEDALLHALSIDDRVLGADHPQVAMLFEMLGDAEARLHRVDLARQYFDHAALIMCARFGEKSPILGAVFMNRGTIEQRSNHLAEAASAYQKALALLDAAGPETQTMRVLLMERYAQVLKATHRAPQAKALLAQVRSFRQK